MSEDRSDHEDRTLNIQRRRSNGKFIILKAGTIQATGRGNLAGTAPSKQEILVSLSAAFKEFHTDEADVVVESVWLGILFDGAGDQSH